MKASEIYSNAFVNNPHVLTVQYRGHKDRECHIIWLSLGEEIINNPQNV